MVLNRKRFGAAFLSLLLGLALAAGCANAPQGSNTGNVKKESRTEQKAPAQIHRTLYRATDKGSQKLNAVTVSLDSAAKDQPLAVMKELVEKAPSGDTTFPAGTKVNKVILKDGTAMVDFNKAFLSRKHNDLDNTLMIYAVVDTLTEFKDITKVAFSVDGKKIDMLGQIDLEDPVARNEMFLKKGVSYF